MVNNPTLAQDLESLHILDMYDCQGISTPRIAKILKTSKNSIIGKIHRIKQAEVSCSCTKPENKEGGMPPRWWDHDLHNRIVATLEQSNTALTLQELEFLMGTPVPMSVLQTSERITQTDGYYSLKEPGS